MPRKCNPGHTFASDCNPFRRYLKCVECNRIIRGPIFFVKHLIHNGGKP